MAKELPYFQFEPAEYLTKDISFCSLSSQGLFINICSYYWQRNCELTKSQILRRLNYPKELEELIEEDIIDVFIDGNISIKFLNDQKNKATQTSNKNKINGGKGGAKKGNKNAKKTTQKQPKNNPKTTQKQGIREEKIREKKIREKKIPLEKEKKFLFKIELIKYGFEKELVEDWLKVRKTKKATNTKTAFNGFIKEIEKYLEKNKVTINGILKICIEKSWSGFKADWLIEDKKSNSTGKVQHRKI